jgi:SAM-dependent methyltransferase
MTDLAPNPRADPPWTHSRYVGLKRRRAGLESMIARHVAPRGGELVAIDLGCSSMSYRSLFQPSVSRYLGADLPENPQADIALDAQSGRVDCPAESADVIISTQVIEHVESPAAYLAEARRLSKRDGLLLLSTHGFWPYHPNPRDYWRWTAAGLQRQLRNAGWETIECLGVLGLAPRLPCLLRTPFTILMQGLVACADLAYDPAGRAENATLYLVAARPAEVPDEA